VQRQGKITGGLFFDLLVFNSESLKEQSLNDLSAILKDKYNIQITKQSIHDRFNEHSVLFIKTALEQMLQKQIDMDELVSGKKNFNRILVKDSVCFQIDKSLAKYYPGSGGNGSKASVRIQFEYNILNGEINDLSLNAFNNQDATNSMTTIELTEKGDLVIRDLAYMGIAVLKEIIRILAYFLCRVSPSVKVYEIIEDKYVELNYKKITNFMKKNNIQTMEKVVYLGSTEKLKVRLIMNLLPEEVVKKRIRKANENSKKKGRNQPSKEYKARLSLNLFITNADETLLSADQAWNYYRLRWQIELMFKIWKSICHIEKVKKVKKHRLECYIYSKIILIVLGWKIMWRVAKRLYAKESLVLSFYKGFKTLIRRKIDQLRNIFLLGNQSGADFIQGFYDLSKTNHILEKKQQNPTLHEILVMCLND